MATPDPRRGDEPGDPDVTPGQPNPDSDNAPIEPEGVTPADADDGPEAFGGDDDIRSGQYGPSADR